MNMKFKIAKLPNDKEILTKSLELVKFPLSKKVKKIADWMIKYINDSQLPNFEKRPGVGIAANQIGVDLRMFYVNVPSKNDEHFIDFFINPKFIYKSIKGAALAQGEGCLSIEKDWKQINTIGLVNRRFSVTLKGYSYIQKKEVEITKSGYNAIVLQHEMDHINGRLFYDRINQKNIWEKQKNLIII